MDVMLEKRPYCILKQRVGVWESVTKLNKVAELMRKTRLLRKSEDENADNEKAGDGKADGKK